jgi:hypothetical protein
MGSCTKGAELLSTSVEAALPQKQVNLARGGLLSEFAYASLPHCRR